MNLGAHALSYGVTLFQGSIFEFVVYLGAHALSYGVTLFQSLEISPEDDSRIVGIAQDFESWVCEITTQSPERSGGRHPFNWNVLISQK